MEEIALETIELHNGVSWEQQQGKKNDTKKDLKGELKSLPYIISID
jgi:hypothetical protein